jgi:hypothetical protein
VSETKFAVCPECGEKGYHKVLQKSDDPKTPWHDLLCKCGHRFVLEK